MRIAVIGYSGAGKSTLARALGTRYSVPVLHMDRVHWAPGWQERDRGEAHRLVHEFMENPDWVIDGNYTKFEYERRLAEADKIIILALSRLGLPGRGDAIFITGVRPAPTWERAAQKGWTGNSCGGFCGRGVPAKNGGNCGALQRDIR